MGVDANNNQSGYIKKHTVWKYYQGPRGVCLVASIGEYRMYNECDRYTRGFVHCACSVAACDVTKVSFFMMCEELTSSVS